MMSNISSKIIEQLRRSEYWTTKTRANGRYINLLICPECGKQEAFSYSDSPFALICNRRNKCGAIVKTLELFPNILRNVEKDNPATKADPNKPARAYLESRGLYQSLNGLVFKYRKNVRDTGSGAVMFPLDREHNIWNGRIFNPPPGEGKTHNVGSTAGLYWKHPGFEYDFKKPIVITEGIIDALSLIELECQAIAILSSGQDPQKIDLLKMSFSLNNDEERNQALKCMKPVLAFDNDPAGIRALKKWKKIYPEAKAILPPKGTDWNDLLLCMSKDKVKGYFKDNYKQFELEAVFALTETPSEYAKMLCKLRYKDLNVDLNFFEFGKCYYQIAVDKAGEVLDKNGEIVINKLSNFIIKVDHYQLDDSIPDRPEFKYCLKVMPQKGRSQKITVTGSELSTPNNLTKMFLTMAKVFWKGLKYPSNKLIEIIIESDAPIVRQLLITGYDKQSGAYVFKDFLITEKGQVIEPDEKGFFKLSHNQYIKPAIFKTIKPTKGIEPQQVHKLIIKAWNKKGAIAIAFMVASWFVKQIKPVLGFFPFLSLYGHTQTGKSRLVRLLNAMQALDEEGLPMSKVNTNKGEIRKLAQRSGLFKALLEGQAQENSKFDYDNFLTLYNHGNPLQTRALKTNDNQTVEVEFLSSICFVTNREPFVKKAQKERFASLFFRDEDITPETTQAFNQLIAIPQSDLAYFIIKILGHRKEIESCWFVEYEKAKIEIFDVIKDPRISENHGLLLAFHWILCRYLKIEYDLLPYILEIAQKKKEDCHHRNASTADLFFDMLDQLEDDVISQCAETDGQYVYVILSKTLKLLKKDGHVIPSIQQLYADLKEHPAFNKSNASYWGAFNETTKRNYKVWVFDVNKLEIDI